MALKIFWQSLKVYLPNFFLSLVPLYEMNSQFAVGLKDNCINTHIVEHTRSVGFG